MSADHGRPVYDSEWSTSESASTSGILGKHRTAKSRRTSDLSAWVGDELGYRRLTDINIQLVRSRPSDWASPHRFEDFPTLLLREILLFGPSLKATRSTGSCLRPNELDLRDVGQRNQRIALLNIELNPDGYLLLRVRLGPSIYVSWDSSSPMRCW